MSILTLQSPPSSRISTAYATSLTSLLPRGVAPLQLVSFSSARLVSSQVRMAFFYPYPSRLLYTTLTFTTGYIGPSPAPEEYLAEPDSALGLGYSESKWVSEHILRTASSQQTALSTTVMRCGQMTGGPSGAWNTHEWFPSLLKSSIKMGKIPAIEGVRR